MAEGCQIASNIELVMRILTPQLLDPLLSHKDSLAYVGTCKEQPYRSRVKYFFRVFRLAWGTLLGECPNAHSRQSDNDGSEDFDFCAAVGIKALCNLAPTCRWINRATLRLALCHACLQGVWPEGEAPEDKAIGRKIKKYRLPCGHTTCGCVYRRKCPKCNWGDVATIDMQTLRSDENPGTIEANDGEPVAAGGVVCRYWARGHCSNGDTCNFAHIDIRSAATRSDSFSSVCSARTRRTIMCKHWSRGDCKNGNRCNFAHGATKKRNPTDEPADAHPEDKALFVAMELGPHQWPVLLRQWHADLSAMKPGQNKSYPGLRPAQRKVLHMLADKFGYEHMSTGIASTLQIVYPEMKPEEDTRNSKKAKPK